MSEKPARYKVPGQENVVPFHRRTMTTGKELKQYETERQADWNNKPYYLTPAEIEALRQDAQRAGREIDELVRQRHRQSESGTDSKEE